MWQRKAKTSLFQSFFFFFCHKLDLQFFCTPTSKMSFYGSFNVSKSITGSSTTGTKSFHVNKGPCLVWHSRKNLRNKARDRWPAGIETDVSFVGLFIRSKDLKSLRIPFFFSSFKSAVKAFHDVIQCYLNKR